MLLEDRRDLKRRYRYTDDAAGRWCDALGTLARLVTDPPAIAVIERDPDDDMVIACALKADADVIVSRDKDAARDRETGLKPTDGARVARLNSEI